MTDAATTPAVVSTTPVKPGWATTEFYFKLAAAGLSVAFASGVFTSNVTLSIAGIIATVLTAMGYTVSRTVVKAAASIFLLLGALAAPALTGCAAAKPDAAAIAAGVVTCSKADLPAAKGLALQLGTEALGGLLTGQTQAQIWTQVSTDAESAAKVQGLAVASCGFGQLVTDLDKLLHPAAGAGVATQGLTASAAVDPLARGRAALAAFQAAHAITRIDP